MESILLPLGASLREAVSRAADSPADGLRIRIPARGAAAACPLMGEAEAGIAAAKLAADDFSPVLGVPPVSHVEARKGWLLFTLSDTFYTAALRHIQNSLPLPADDCGCHALNRMLCMARAGGDACPPDARVQRAWLLTLCSGQSDAARRRAQTALLSMTRHLPPKERAALAADCGGVADAAARILGHQWEGEKL